MFNQEIDFPLANILMMWNKIWSSPAIEYEIWGLSERYLAQFQKSELAIPESYKGYPKLPNILSRCFLAAAHETLSDQGFSKTADIDVAVTAKNRRG